jgi:L-amino acid N-acyltransferase YncA
MVVRPLRLEDYPGVRRVDELTQRQYRGVGWDQLSEEDKEPYLVSRASEFATNVGTGYGFVALREDEVIGFVFAHETLPFPGDLYIRYVGIDPAYQGAGIGLLLYVQLIEHAKQRGIQSITTLINLDNAPSMKLHQKAGFWLRDRKEAVLDLFEGKLDAPQSDQPGAADKTAQES